MKLLIFLLLFFSLLSCSFFVEGSSSDFAYNDIVSIFALSEYIKDYKRIEDYLVPSYGMNKVVNQKSYSNVLLAELDTYKKRSKFLKDAINYYISFKVSSGDLEISYYKEGAYNNKRKFFDNSYRIDVDVLSLPSIYWRVLEFKDRYIKRKQIYSMLLFSKEYYVSSSITERYYYDEYRRLIKQEFFEGGNLKSEEYYHNNNRVP